MTRLLLALGVAALAAAGCDPSPTRSPTDSMVEVLAAKVAQARADPARHAPVFVNREQAALADGQPLGSAPRAFTMRAHVLLRGGRTQAAIDHLSAGDSAAWDAERTVLLGVAHLRLGEERNCLAAGHGPEVCIVPFRGAAVHADPAPARRAAALFRRAAERDSTDLGARWLLNIAHQALGDYPEGVPPGLLIPGLGADADGPFPRLRNVAPDRGVATMGLAGGAALDDFDGDGDLDLFKTSWGFDHPARYFENDGRGTFTDRTREAGLMGITGGLNLVHGDIDNDGDLDVLILRGGWVSSAGEYPNSLLRNDGGRFTDVTFAAGLLTERPTQTAVLADVDGDGWLDVFIGNEHPPAGFENPDGEAYPSELYLNQHDGTFRDVSRQAGLDVALYVKGAAALDADADGRPDLYLSVMRGPNRLFLNRSEPGRVRFEEAEGAAGAAAPTASFAAAGVDWDQDGADDLLVLPYPAEGFASGMGLATDAARERLGLPMAGQGGRLFRNDGGAFRDHTAAAGLGRFDAAVMGVGVEDFDGDGAFDLYAGTGSPSFGALVPNRLLMSGPGGRLIDRTYASGTGHLQKGHGVSFGDVDGDLDPDLFVVMGGAFDADTAADILFENPWQDRGWVVLRLEGRRANRSAIGARVALRLRDPDGRRRTLRRTVGAGGSFGSNSLQLEVGVGAATVEAVEVAWPGSGTRSTFRGVERGGRYRLVEGARRPEPIELRPGPAARPAPHAHRAGG